MGAPFSDITLYAPTLHAVGTPEYWDETSLNNFICDLYVQKMNGYKPPKTSRITIQPGFHGIWDRTWKTGSIVAIAPFYNYEIYTSLDRKGKYKYILDIVQASTLQLSEEYHWDRTVFEKAYNDIIESNFEFTILYPKKMSRDKQKFGQVIIEKTEKVTTLYLAFNFSGKIKKVKLFDKKNWFWYDTAYEMAKNSRWLDNNTFGVSSKKNDKFGYYSLVDDVIVGKLDFNENEILI